MKVVFEQFQQNNLVLYKECKLPSRKLQSFCVPGVHLVADVLLDFQLK